MSMTTTTAPRRLSATTRRAVLTAHIIFSVGLLGDSAGFLAVAVRGATTTDPQVATTCYELLRMFSLVFGIPLSFAALITGAILALGGPWGLLRTPWVTAKLLLLLSVILVGALAIDPALNAMLDGPGGRQSDLILASGYDVLALAVATGLAVYKPGRTRQRRRPRQPGRATRR